MTTTIRARIYARGKVSFAKFLFFPNCWRPIFLVLSKLDGCQVDLPNYWSCSYSHKWCTCSDYVQNHVSDLLNKNYRLLIFSSIIN
jgi:hypothetical protein